MRLLTLNPIASAFITLASGVYARMVIFFRWITSPISRLINSVSLKEFLLFAVIVFVGFLIGNFIVGLFPAIDVNTPIGALIAFVVPVLIVYLIWAKWGRKAAD